MSRESGWPVRLVVLCQRKTSPFSPTTFKTPRRIENIELRAIFPSTTSQHHHLLTLRYPSKLAPSLSRCGLGRLGMRSSVSFCHPNCPSMVRGNSGLHQGALNGSTAIAKRMQLCFCIPPTLRQSPTRSCAFGLNTADSNRFLTQKNPTMSLSSKLAITDVDLKGKRVLIRVCLPIPNNKQKCSG